MGTVVDMRTAIPAHPWKIIVHFARREDGGLRAWCDEIPGFALSHIDIDAVLSDVQPALEGILTYQLGERYITTPLCDIRIALEQQGVIEPTKADRLPELVEYVAQRAA